MIQYEHHILSYEGSNRNVLTLVMIIVTMDDDLQRLYELLEIAQKRVHELEREREELDWERTEKFIEYQEADNLFRKKGEVLEAKRDEITNIRKDINSLLGP